jgi:hypothetical protein
MRTSYVPARNPICQRMLANSSDNMRHAECRRDPEMTTIEGRILNIPRNPKLQLSPDSSLNHDLVQLFPDEPHWQDMANGLTIMPKSENSR